MTARSPVEAEAFAWRCWAWLGQVQRDRSLPISALRTAATITGELRRGAARVDVTAMAAFLAERGCHLDRDVRALVQAGHLTWRAECDGIATPSIKLRARARCGGGAS